MIERPPTLTTWTFGSMRTTGDSVEAMTSLSRRLSRISIDSTWWRRSFVSVIVYSTPGRIVAVSIRGDDGPDLLSFKHPREVALDETVDDLDGAAVLRVRHQLQHGVLHHHVGKIHLPQLIERDARDELRVRILLRIGRIEPILVLDVDH